MRVLNAKCRSIANVSFRGCASTEIPCLISPSFAALPFSQPAPALLYIYVRRQTERALVQAVQKYLAAAELLSFKLNSRSNVRISLLSFIIHDG